ncbi:DUF4097 family beta strand repeat-containing protein [Bacillus weihaiensis]|uniref:Uncharacterized protein n=1 Tax=Bacillus weihaiensis TaxID=1547283 RepID=A0A1L3MMR1_9BACI|nr:DUF4097 domain-containing protein [Bacillus weihaiensis]APH03635.1 hypothetical protein A9C19_02060 [Bacillus weihaiensis]
MKEQKIRILKLVEEGKLSADEALSLIESLENEQQQQEIKLTALSTEVIDQGQFKGEASDSQDTKHSLGSKLMDWVDTAVKKVKDIDLDLNFGKSIDLQHIYQFKAAEFQHIDISVPNGSVSIQPWTEQDVRVECDAKMYRVENTEQARQLFLSTITCFVENNRFVFDTDKKTMKLMITIHVPEHVYETIRLKVFNGPISGQQLQAEEFKAKTANGALTFSAMKAGKAEFETANGQIQLADSTFEKLEAETVSGVIQIEGIVKKADLQSFNGNIALSLNDENTETLYTKTTTGNIEIMLPDNSEVVGELKSNLGLVSARMKEASISYEKNETVQKELKFHTSEQPKLTLFADSKTGSIVIREK